MNQNQLSLKYAVLVKKRLLKEACQQICNACDGLNLAKSFRRFQDVPKPISKEVDQFLQSVQSCEQQGTWPPDPRGGQEGHVPVIDQDLAQCRYEEALMKGMLEKGRKLLTLYGSTTVPSPKPRWAFCMDFFDSMWKAAEHNLSSPTFGLEASLSPADTEAPEQADSVVVVKMKSWLNMTEDTWGSDTAELRHTVPLHVSEDASQLDSAVDPIVKSLKELVASQIDEHKTATSVYSVGCSQLSDSCLSAARGISLAQRERDFSSVMLAVAAKLKGESTRSENDFQSSHG